MSRARAIGRRLNAVLGRSAPAAPPAPPMPEEALAQEARLRRLLAGQAGEECVVLAKLAVGDDGTVRTWRRGLNAVAHRLPTGTPVATFLDRQGGDSPLYDGGEGVGISGNFTTHAAVVSDYLCDAAGVVTALRLFEVYPGSRGLRKRIYPVDDGLFGTRNARAYHAINGPDGQVLGGAANPCFGLVFRV
ncbi:MAG: hypothetical protein R3D85_01580 [Paracoccaceae bacterium]